jgi:hypothetical protein
MWSFFATFFASKDLNKNKLFNTSKPDVVPVPSLLNSSTTDVLGLISASATFCLTSRAVSYSFSFIHYNYLRIFTGGPLLSILALW